MMDLVAYIVEVCRKLEGKKVTFETLFDEETKIKKSTIETIIGLFANNRNIYARLFLKRSILASSS